ncbi:MAG TPA: hypothetical protein VEH09_06650, partial [Thermodesulfobacteriota bacterium]|nr:hypothetical protein [Thermodesulfobacteriota bacterium]
TSMIIATLSQDDAFWPPPHAICVICQGEYQDKRNNKFLHVLLSLPEFLVLPFLDLNKGNICARLRAFQYPLKCVIILIGLKIFWKMVGLRN